MAVTPDFEPVFLDTAYVNALINTRDQWHEAAVQWERKLATDRRQLITTEFVLVEIADGLARVRFRLQAAQLGEAGFERAQLIFGRRRNGFWL